MALNLDILNTRGLRDPSKCACLLGELSTLRIDVAAVQETHFFCTADCRVLENDYVVLSAYGSRSSVGGSLLIGCNTDVNLVFADDGGRLVVADIAVKRFEFMRPILLQRIFLFSAVSAVPRRFETVLIGDWNAILDPKIDRVGRGARGSRKCESSLIDFMVRHDLDHPGRDLWTWLDSPPSVHARSWTEC